MVEGMHIQGDGGSGFVATETIIEGYGGLIEKAI